MGTEAENTGQETESTDVFAAMEETMSAAFDRANTDEAAGEGEGENADTEAVNGQDGDNAGDDTGNEDSATQDAASGDDEGDEDTSSDDGEDGDTDQETDKDAGADDESLSPPERWSADDKEAFNALPREAQELVLKRESDVQAHLTRESQKIVEEKRRLGGIADMIEQRREPWAMAGMTPDQAVTHILALSDFAGRAPADFVKWFAEQHNVDLSAAAAGDDAGDPHIKSLQQKVDRLEKRETVTQQEAQQARQQAVEQAITEFSKDTEKHPYFEELQGDVADLLPGIVKQFPNENPNQWLERAYGKAVWANESTRQKALAAEEKAKEAQRRKQAQDAAKKARKSADTNVKSSGASPGDKPARSMDDTMSEAYDRAVGAA